MERLDLSSYHIRRLRRVGGKPASLLILTPLAACGGVDLGRPDLPPLVIPDEPEFVEDPVGTFTAPNDQSAVLDQSLASGDLTVIAKGGSDNIRTGSGADVIDGGAGNDTINSGSGNDVIIGGAGNDNINAGPGNDIVRGGLGADSIIAGSGDDVIVIVGATGASDYAASDITNPGGSGLDVSSVLALDNLNGQSQSEGASGETIDGGNGSDTLLIYGEVDLRGLTLQNLTTLQVNSNLTLTADQLSMFTAIKGNGQSELVIVDDPNDGKVLEVDLSSLDVSNLAKLTTQGQVLLSIDDISDLAGIGQIVGDGNLTIVLKNKITGAHDVLLSSLSGKVTGLDEIQIDNLVTLVVDTADGLGAVGVGGIGGEGMLKVMDAVSSASLLSGITLDDDVSLLDGAGKAKAIDTVGGTVEVDPEITVSNLYVAESAREASFVFKLSKASDETVYFDVTKPDNEVVTLSFRPGVTEISTNIFWGANIAVGGHADQSISLSNAIGADIADDSATLIILDGSTTNKVLTLDEVYTASSKTGTDVELVEIELEAGKSYRIDAVPADNSRSSLRDPAIFDIVDNKGVSTGQGNDDGGLGRAAAMIYTPTESGTHTIVLNLPDSSFIGGTVSLTVKEITLPTGDDLGNAPDPAGAISIWQTKDAYIEQADDTDTIAITLEAGVAVDITVYGNDHGVFGDLFSPRILSFMDSAGNEIDASLIQPASAYLHLQAEIRQITFTPSVSGTYYIKVGSESGVGDYSVSVAAKDQGIYGIRSNEEFPLTGDAYVDAFFHLSNASDAYWKNKHVITDRDGDGITHITYSVPDANSQWSEAIHNDIHSAPASNFVPASGAVLDTYLGLFPQISAFANIVFTQVPDEGVKAGTFRVGTTDYLAAGPGFFANGWSGLPESAAVGETWLNLGQALINIGGEGSPIDYQAYLVNRTIHEYTHNLGLQHADRSVLSSEIDPKYLGQEYSVMMRSMSGEVPDAAYMDFFPQSLMWLDIQAIQAAYGTNTVSTAGSQTYSYDTSSRYFETIWDYSGVDTLSVSGSEDVVIDLTPGTWQDVGSEVNYYGVSNEIIHTRTATVFITPDTVIENATTGSGNDSLTGNSAANRLNGGGGNDQLRGGAGADVFAFDASWGADTVLDFEDGSDKLDLSGSGLSYADLSISVVGSDTVISDGNGNTITLTGITSGITDDDFVF